MISLNTLFEDIRLDLKKKFGIDQSSDIRLVFLFNPSHEMALVDNSDNYTPTANVRLMEHDLYHLPAVFANDGDLIVENANSVIRNTKGFEIKILMKVCIPFPWGWNRTARNFLQKLGVSINHMPDDCELDWIREFACRKFHAQYISEFIKQKTLEEWKDRFVGNHMEFIDDVANLRDVSSSLIFKLPWSSSGRGIFVTEKLDNKTCGKLQGFINKQGGFLKDVYYHKIIDFAMEFYVFSDKRVKFAGYSLFQTDSNGKYGGNMVDKQDVIESIIASNLNNDTLLPAIRDTHKKLIEMTMAGKYTGFIGIDMMVVDTPEGRKCHPCVEINPRMNMGILAMAAHLRPFFFNEGGGGGSVVGDRRRSSTRTPPEVMRERGFHTCFNDRFISIKYS